MAKPSDKAGDTNQVQSEKYLLSFQVVLDILERNGGGSEARALEEAMTVDENEMENEENEKRDSNVCLAFLLDLSTFHRKDFTLVKSS